MIIRFTPSVERRLAKIVESHCRSAVQRARIERELATALRRISDFPLIHGQVREFPGCPARQFIVEPYRFFYVVDEPRNAVWIVDIWHRREKPVAPWIPPPAEEHPK